MKTYEEIMAMSVDELAEYLTEIEKEAYISGVQGDKHNWEVTPIWRKKVLLGEITID